MQTVRALSLNDILFMTQPPGRPALQSATRPAAPDDERETMPPPAASSASGRAVDLFA